MVHGILLAHNTFSDAEDLMQDVFLQAIQRLPGLRQDGTFGSWLAAIARHLSVDYHRRQRPAVEANELNSGIVFQDEASSVLDAIRGLPETYRETLMLRLVEGMTGPEIAARTGLKPESVRVNLCRGMKMLRTQLEGQAKHA